MRRDLWVASLLSTVAMAAFPAAAQDDCMVPLATPAQPTAIALGTGPLPCASVVESWHRQYGSRFVRT